jgi:enoyl-CoA hydratase/carnithine racemase
MIHEASTFDWGTKTQFRKTLNSLEKLDKSIADIYMTRFKGEREEIETMIVNETWFTADEAVEAGLADKVNDVKQDEEDLDPEEFKNSVLARFRKGEPAGKTNSNKNILNQFKRQE